MSNSNCFMLKTKVKQSKIINYNNNIIKDCLSVHFENMFNLYYITTVAGGILWPICVCTPIN